MRSEQDCRKEGFEEGTPVVLADGKEWTLPKPRVRLAPANNDRGFKTVLFRPDGGVFVGLMNLLDEVSSRDEARIADFAKLELAIGKHLLLTNYDLTDDEVDELLQFSYEEKDDPEGYAIREGVVGVMFGFGSPKPSAAGDESPSSPTASTPTDGPSTT